MLDIDPSPLDGSVVYTPLHYLLEVEGGAGVTTVGAPIVLTAVDTEATIDFPTETVLHGNRIADLEVDFTGVELRHPDGTAYSGPVSVSPVIATDVPMPFPEAGFEFWTIQPGGLIVDPPARITVPLLPLGYKPGDQLELWAFDHGTNDWVHYGNALVNADGATATSIPGEGLPFTGWGANFDPNTDRRDVGEDPSDPGGGSRFDPELLLSSNSIVPANADPEDSTANMYGEVFDAEGNALHGVAITGPGGVVAITDYVCDGDHLASRIRGVYSMRNVPIGRTDPETNVFRAANPTIVATAYDVNGNIYTAEVEIDIQALLDETGQPPPIIKGPDLFLDDYPVVDDKGDLLLHRDVKTDLHSHLILEDYEHEGRVIADSTRHRREVEVLAQKLGSMGFRSRNTTSKADRSGVPESGRYQRRSVDRGRQEGLSAVLHRLVPQGSDSQPETVRCAACSITSGAVCTRCAELDWGTGALDQTRRSHSQGVQLQPIVSQSLVSLRRREGPAQDEDRQLHDVDGAGDGTSTLLCEGMYEMGEEEGEEAKMRGRVGRCRVREHALRRQRNRRPSQATRRRKLLQALLSPPSMGKANLAGRLSQGRQADQEAAKSGSTPRQPTRPPS